MELDNRNVVIFLVSLIALTAFILTGLFYPSTTGFATSSDVGIEFQFNNSFENDVDDLPVIPPVVQLDEEPFNESAEVILDDIVYVDDVLDSEGNYIGFQEPGPNFLLWGLLAFGIILFVVIVVIVLLILKRKKSAPRSGPLVGDVPVTPAPVVTTVPVVPASLPNVAPQPAAPAA